MSDNTLQHESLGELLMRFAARVERLRDQELAQLELPLTLPQYRILARVADGHTSLTELCQLARRSMATMSESVDGLVRRELLTRVRSTADRRSFVLELTPKGEEALNASTQPLAELATNLEALVPASMRKQLYRCLTSVTSRADSMVAN